MLLHGTTRENESDSRGFSFADSISEVVLSSLATSRSADAVFPGNTVSNSVSDHAIEHTTFFQQPVPSLHGGSPELHVLSDAAHSAFASSALDAQ